MILKKGRNHLSFDKYLENDYNDLYDCEEKDIEGVIKDLLDNVVFVTDGCKEKWVWKQVKNSKVVCCISKNIPKILGDMELKTDDKKKKYLRDLFRKNIKKMKVNNIDFYPHNSKKKVNFNEPTFNTFNGFGIDYDETFLVDESKINDILYHIDLLANFEDKSKEYIINWLASIIQRPEKKTGVCPVFISDQGAGKTSFMEWVGNEIIGKDWSLTISNNDNIFKNFNAELNNKLFTILDEAQLDGNYKKKADQLKSLITQQYIRIEYKGIDPVVMNDRNNYVILTNNEFPVKVEQTDRRFAVFNVSNVKVRDDYYFKKLNEAFEDDNVKKHFFHYLLNRDLSNFHAERDIPNTKAKIELKKESAPSPVRFAIEIIKNGIKYNEFNLDDIINSEESTTKFNTEKIYNSYKNYMQQKCPGERILVENGFITKLSNLLNIKTNKIKGKKVTTINKRILTESVCNYFKVKNITEVNIDEIEYDDSGIENEEDIGNIKQYIKDNNLCKYENCKKNKHVMHGAQLSNCITHSK